MEDAIPDQPLQSDAAPNLSTLATEKVSSDSKPSKNIRPNEAVKLLLPIINGIVQAKEHIVDGLRDGAIRARTKQHWISYESGLAEAWAERNDQACRDTYLVLSPSKWMQSCDWAKDVSNWNWMNGRFHVTLREGRQAERHMFASIRFDRAEIAKLAALLNTSSRREIGGRARDYKRWSQLWQCAVAVVDDRETFQKLMNPTALMRAMREVSNRRWPEASDANRFGDSMVRDVANAAWSILRERS